MLTEPSESKIWSWVSWDWEPRTIMLARASSNLAVNQSVSQSISESLKSPAAMYLAGPSGKISPVIIHHHFDGDKTRINREFHSKFQSLCVTTLRIRSGIACQTFTSNGYVNTQKFLTENKALFSMLGRAGAKPYKLIIKRISPPS
jgi:hypothetical protein